MTPQEHLTECEEFLDAAKMKELWVEVAPLLSFAAAHAQAGMLSQSIQDSQNMGQLNATAQAARTQLLRQANFHSQAQLYRRGQE